MQTQRKTNNVAHHNNTNDYYAEDNSNNNNGDDNDESKNEVNQFSNDFYNDDLYDYKDYFLSGIANENDGEEEDDDADGPLAIKANPQQHQQQRNHRQDDFYPQNNYDQYYDDDNNEMLNEEDDDLNIDTFFKKVDSIELCKPKKAKIVSNYLFGDMLGDGSYGKVKECLDLRTLNRRAVKIINLKIVSRKIPKGIQNVRKEIHIMRRLNHKNVIKLYDVFEKNMENLYGHKNKDTDPTHDGPLHVMYEKPPKIYIFMDYCMTSLEKLLKNAPQERLCNWQASFYFRQLIDGLEYLHSLGIIHNDIKPGNLLIQCDNTLKICDFSISAQLKLFNDYDLTANDSRDEQYDLFLNDPSVPHNPNSFPIVQCTPMFQCPEMLAECVDEELIVLNAAKIDVWSCGVSLYQITTGKLPFHGNTVHQIYENIRSTSYDIKIPDFVDRNLNRLLSGMLQREPHARWSLQQIRESEWYKKKHAYVYEELTQWPQDVLQNETCAYRMLPVLEKLITNNGEEDNRNDDGLTKSMVSTQQTSQVQHQQQQQQSIADENYLAASSNNTRVDLDNQKQNGMVTSEYSSNGNSESTRRYGNGNGNKVMNNSDPPPAAKQYAQATKLKRNNCVIN